MYYITISNKLMGNPDRRIPGVTRRISEFITRTQKNYVIRSKTHKLDPNSEIVVSLTTFPVRNKVACISIKSLLMQTMMPCKIIVWLAKNQYDIIPEDFKELEYKGVTFRFVDDLKSHKKYYYSLKEYRNKLVVTVDDDLIYPENLIENLYKKHLEFPECVVCYRGRTVSFTDNRINPYSEWKINTKHGIKEPTYLVMPSTGGGVLYPHDCVSEELFNLDKIMELAPSADDLWVKWMHLLKGTKVIKCQCTCPILSHLITVNDVELSDVNTSENDKVIERLSGTYPGAYRRMLDEFQKN